MSSTPLLPPVLIVDDDPNDIFFIRRRLDKSGVPNPVIAFIDSEDALAYLRSILVSEASGPPKPCVMFLDIKMPKVHGLVLLKWARHQPGLDGLKIVMLSGSDEPQDEERTVKLGADQYFVKFPEPEVLAQVVTSACARPSP